MSPIPRKCIGLLLAAVLLAAVFPWAVAAGKPGPAGDSPLRIDIATCKKSYTLLSVITYTVTVTNTGGEALHSVSAEALPGRDLVPLEKGSRLTAEMASLAPGESLQLRCRARLNTLRRLDILLFPVQWLCKWFTGPGIDLMDNHFDNGRACVEANARARLLSFYDAAYDAVCTVRVRHGFAASDDFSGVLENDFFEGYEGKRAGIAIEPDKAYYLLLSKARNLTAGMQAGGDTPGASLEVSAIRHNVAWTFEIQAAGDDRFALRSLASGLVVAVEGASNEDGAALRLERYTGQAHQLWRKQADRDGQVSVVNVHSGKAIDIGGGGALVQKTPNAGASQAWELMDIDAGELAEPAIPDLSSPAAWIANALRYPQEGKPVPAGPIYLQWYQGASLGEVDYYELVFDGEMPVLVRPTGALLMGYRWYSTKVARHAVRITAVLKNGERVATALRSFPVTKKGLGWGTLHRVEDMNLAWYYNWYTTPCTGLGSWLQFEPQVWGDFADLGLDGLRGRGFRGVMAFNEPDSATHANMSVARAVALWPRFMESGLRLGSPAMSNNAQAAEQWLTPFMDAIDRDPVLDVDFMVLHIYDSGADADAVLDIVDRTWRKYRKPIWIKEFAVASFSADSPWGAGKGNPAVVAAFMAKLLGALDSRPYVERYAWYPFGTDDAQGGASALFDYGTGELTMLGEVYKGLGMP